MRQRLLALAALVLVAVLSVVGCLVVTPLDDYEADSSTSAGDSGGSGGSGGSSNGGSSGSSDGGSGGSSQSDGGSTTSATTSSSPCTSNAECVERANNHASRCSNGECIALQTGDCTQVYPESAFKHENPIYVGAFAQLPLDQPELSSALFAFRLALGEISGDSFGGLLLPNGEGDTERRPVVLVACNNSEGQARIDAGAEHLIQSVGTSAILATLMPGDLRRLFETHKESKVFWLSPVGATEAVADLEDEDLVWTMLGQPKNLVPVYRDLVQDLVEPYIRNVRGAGEAPLKLVLVGGEDAFSQELSDLVAEELRWNGKSPGDNFDAGDFRAFSLSSGSDLVSMAQEIVGFRPDIVVSTAGEMVTRFMTGLVFQIEGHWEGTGSAPRPFYVLSPFNSSDLDSISTMFQDERDNNIDEHPERRLVGVTAAGPEEPELQNEYQLDLDTAFGEFDPSLDTGNYYDAFYFLAYAIYAAQEQNPTGPDIARGMRRLLEGEKFSVGLKDIADVTQALAGATTKIQLNGTLGPPNFDSDGVRIDPGAVYCLNEALNVRPNDLRYDPENQRFSGEFSCFSNFAP